MNAQTESPAIAEAISQYNVCAKNCPARLIFARLADKWALLIVKTLKQEPHRFNQLRRAIEGISQKALSQTLQKLERDGLVNRQAFPTVPVTVEYSLTDLGTSLSELIDPLVVWSETHIEQVVHAQHHYDARNAG